MKDDSMDEELVRTQLLANESVKQLTSDLVRARGFKESVKQYASPLGVGTLTDLGSVHNAAIAFNTAMDEAKKTICVTSAAKVIFLHRDASNRPKLAEKALDMIPNQQSLPKSLIAALESLKKEGANKGSTMAPDIANPSKGIEGSKSSSGSHKGTGAKKMQPAPVLSSPSSGIGCSQSPHGSKKGSASGKAQPPSAKKSKKK